MLVPTAMQQLDHTNPALYQTASEERAVGKRAWVAHIGSVHLQRLRRFRFDVSQLWNARLHAKRHLVLRNAGRSFRIPEFRLGSAVQFLKGIEHQSAVCPGDPGWIGQI